MTPKLWSWYTSSSAMSLFLLGTVALLVVATVLALTRLYTSARWQFDLWTTANASHPPPRLPYTIPWLGQALDFLAPRPGDFYRHVFSKYESLRPVGSCTLRLAHQKTHLLFNPTAVQHLFRAPLGRLTMNMQLIQNALGMSLDQANRFYGGNLTKEEQAEVLQTHERLNHEYLLKTDRVNELTANFFTGLRTELDGDGQQETEICLYSWLRSRMFKASTDAFMGTELLEMYPDFEGDFFEFDRGFMTMFFGIPRIFAPRIYSLRRKILDRLEAWHLQMQKNVDGKPADPHTSGPWEPNYGSRANRARQIFYGEVGIELRSRGSLDLGFMFGISSNAIPATGWMLMHLFDPNGDTTVLPRIMDEIKTARAADGSVDVAILVQLSLLASAFHEILRLYVDVLVTREVTSDQLLPLEEGKQARKVFIEKGSTVLAPSWLGHRDGSVWNNPPYDVFYAERFLKEDPETGKMIFTTAGSNGKLFPFGGGKTICPGRVFAKQEVLASLAYVLLNFDFSFKGYVNEQGKPINKFPGLREGFTGSGIIVMDGDFKMTMKRKPQNM